MSAAGLIIVGVPATLERMYGRFPSLVPILLFDLRHSLSGPATVTGIHPYTEMAVWFFLGKSALQAAARPFPLFLKAFLHCFLLLLTLKNGHGEHWNAEMKSKRFSFCQHG